jgi:hypothetical protein
VQFKRGEVTRTIFVLRFLPHAEWSQNLEPVLQPRKISRSRELPAPSVP